MNVYLMKLYSSFWSLSYARTISGRDMATHHDRNMSGSDPSQKAAQDTLKDITTEMKEDGAAEINDLDALKALDPVTELDPPPPNNDRTFETDWEREGRGGP